MVGVDIGMKICVSDGWNLLGAEPMELIDAKTQPLNSMTLDLSCTDRLFRKEADGPLSFTITSPNQVPCKRIAITSSARFFEIYSINAKMEEVYIATCRGTSVAKNTFECIHDTPLAISTIKIKFLSLKPVASEPAADFSLKLISLHVRDQTSTPSSSPSPPTAAPSNPASMQAPSMDGLLLMLPMLKATIMQDLSQLLDTKLAPIYHKLQHMETALHTLENSVQTLTAQYPTYNTISSDHAELTHSISYIDHDDIPTIDDESHNASPKHDANDDLCATDNEALQFVTEKEESSVADNELKKDMRTLLGLLRCSETKLDST